MDTGDRQRRTDQGFLCTVALRLSQAWDFVDKRDIDKHFLSLAILYGSVKVTVWAMHFAEQAIKLAGAAPIAADMGEAGAIATQATGFEAAAIIAAVLAPYMALQAAALKYYFETRSE